jgi:bromodomain adjacent to zinc finger domain protein 1A
LDNLYKNPVEKAQNRESIANLAESYFKLVKNTQGRSVKNIGLDVYTISEMLRLYFITSASPHHSKIKFWFQQRGGYTRMDEIGIDFVLNEKHIIQKLEIYSVYELEANEKLKILASLCHQLMSQVTFRDLLEDNFQSIATLRAQHRDLQTKENRRIREETSERWKKRLESQAQAKARLEEIKTSNNNTSANSSSNQLNKLISKDRNSTSSDSLVQLAADEAENKKILADSAKKREEFLKKEKNILDEIYYLQTKCTMTPIGRDRYYRRYWIFNSLPGIYVEDEDYDFKISASLETSLISPATSDEPTTAATEVMEQSESVDKK